MKLNPIGNNQSEIEFESLGDNIRVLFSYSTPVAAKVGCKVYSTSQKWSKTTSKHINNWLEGWDTLQHEIKEQSFFDNLIK